MFQKIRLFLAHTEKKHDTTKHLITELTLDRAVTVRVLMTHCGKGCCSIVGILHVTSSFFFFQKCYTLLALSQTSLLKTL